MAAVVDRRMTAEIEGDFVVFLIGMRINPASGGSSKWVPVPDSRCRACCASSNVTSKQGLLGGHRSTLAVRADR